MNREIRDVISAALDELVATADRTWGTGAIEPQLARLLALFEQHAKEREAIVQQLISRMARNEPYLRLGVPGVVELLEYTMHKLRWPEIKNALTSIDVPGSDMRERAEARRVLRAFSDEWEDGDIYDAYRAK